MGPFKQSVDFTLGNSFFGAAKLIKNADFDKYKHSGYGIGFDAHVSFRFLMVVALVSSSLHVNIRKNHILLLGKGPTQGLNNTTLAAKKEYAINFREQHNKICLSLHYNSANRYLLTVMNYKNSKQKILK